jgi:class 3 adenylate cyclase
MMEPRIQYAKTEDGVSIALSTLGEGNPLVLMPSLPFSHIQLEWQSPEARAWFESLARRRMLVRYDTRGCGLSQRDAVDFSIDAQVLDLEAVAERVGLGRFALMGQRFNGFAAIIYAVRHPERVSHLLLWCAAALGTELHPAGSYRAALSLADKDWELYMQTVASLWTEWADSKEAQRLAERWRQSLTPEGLQAFRAARPAWDVTGLLPQVRCPTLVMHRRELDVPAIDAARRLAAEIPDARLAVLEGANALPSHGDAEAVTRAIEEFLGEREDAPAPALAKEDIHTILFTDMESSTALTQRLGDAKAQELVRTHNSIVRDALKKCGGSEIKHTGDGIMASFASASGALECAVAIQQGVASHVEQQPDTPLAVRIGLNAGEPVAEEEDLFGAAVIRAARIAALADGGEILVANVVRELSEGKGFLFADRGDTALRGFESSRCAGGRASDGAAHPVREDRRRRQHSLLDAGGRDASGALDTRVQPHPVRVALPGNPPLVRRLGDESAACQVRS